MAVCDGVTQRYAAALRHAEQVHGGEFERIDNAIDIVDFEAQVRACLRLAETASVESDDRERRRQSAHLRFENAVIERPAVQRE